jgi:hypothetical protein
MNGPHSRRDPRACWRPVLGQHRRHCGAERWIVAWCDHRTAYHPPAEDEPRATLLPSNPTPRHRSRSALSPQRTLLGKSTALPQAPSGIVIILETADRTRYARINLSFVIRLKINAIVEAHVASRSRRAVESRQLLIVRRPPLAMVGSVARLTRDVKRRKRRCSSTQKRLIRPAHRRAKSRYSANRGGGSVLRFSPYFDLSPVSIRRPS